MAATSTIMWQVVERRRLRFFLLVALMIADGALNSIGIGMVLPVLQAVLQDGQINPVLSALFPVLLEMSQEHRVVALAVGTIIVFAIRAATAYANAVASRAFAERLRVEWVDGVGRNYLLGRYRRLLDRKQGELLNNWQTETASASRYFLVYLNYMAATLQVVALLIMGLIVDWRILVVTVSIGAVMLFLSRRLIYGTAADLGRRKLELNQSMTGQMAENLVNAREIKLLGAEARRLTELGSTASRLKTVFVKLSVYGAMPQIVSEFFAVAALMTLIAVTIVVLGLSPSVVLPTLAFFLVVFYRLTTATSQMVGARMRALNELHAIALVHRLATDVTGREETAVGRDIERLEGDIVLEGVGYAYGDGGPALSGVDMSVPRGQVLFLVGPSGSGKSTLLDLLMRLDDPQEGRILVDGEDAREFSLDSWRCLFGYVSQDAALFNGTIRSNLMLSNPTATEDQVAEACRLAGISAMLEGLADGLDTVVGERGLTVSGGQRKRIAIARALLGDPAVLILDEATTSFEERMERKMIGDLRDARPGLTVIQVTHRLQTAVDADHIVALDQGRVAASGSWDDIAETRQALAGQAGATD